MVLLESRHLDKYLKKGGLEGGLAASALKAMPNGCKGGGMNTM